MTLDVNASEILDRLRSGNAIVYAQTSGPPFGVADGIAEGDPLGRPAQDPMLYTVLIYDPVRGNSFVPNQKPWDRIRDPGQVWAAKPGQPVVVAWIDRLPRFQFYEPPYTAPCAPPGGS